MRESQVMRSPDQVPATKKPRFHGDDRRIGWFDVYPPEVQDINIVKIPKAGTIVAWHHHNIQTDYWFVPQGKLQVGLYDEEHDKLSWEFLCPERGEVLSIPPPIWHGYKCIEDNTILVYGLTEKYNPDDEFRHFYGLKPVSDPQDVSRTLVPLDWNLKPR